MTTRQAASQSTVPPDAAVALRPIGPADMPFLYELYASTRERELAAVSWDAARKAAFLRMQFDAQHSHYQEHYPAAAFDLVLVDDVPAGRLYVDRRSDELRIIDITIVDALRNRRIGTRLITELQREAAASSGMCVRNVKGPFRRNGPETLVKRSWRLQRIRSIRSTRCPVRIHVERENPAQRLYARLGFRQIADRGVYLFLEWTADDRHLPLP